MNLLLISRACHNGVLSLTFISAKRSTCNYTADSSMVNSQYLKKKNIHTIWIALPMCTVKKLKIIVCYI